MLLFPIYAMFVWYLCLRWRRTWVGVLILCCAVAAVFTLAMIDLRVRQWMGVDPSPLTSFQLLLWVEALAIGAIGVFMLSLPLRRAQVPCRGCGYELLGLEDDNPTCPECGLAFAAAKPRVQTCPVCRKSSPMDAIKPVCGLCAAGEVPARAGACEMKRDGESGPGRSEGLVTT